MIRRPPRSTRTDTLFPDTTLFRSLRLPRAARGRGDIAGPAGTASESLPLTVRRVRPAVQASVQAALRALHFRGMIAPNNSFKPNLLRYTNNMSETARHVVASAPPVGLNQELCRTMDKPMNGRTAIG